MGLANVAATIHANMCEDSRFGYSWSPRWGTDGYGYVTWNIEGRNYTIKVGDYDCSSSTITAWQKALEGTPYEGALDGATYTGNMRSVFVNSGLFDVWDTNSTEAHRGDLYLNDNSHVAMCQDGGSDGVYNWDCLSEFCINEFGDVYGGQTGDQTGGEARINGYYGFPWNCTLHYNGKADGTSGGSEHPGGGSSGGGGTPAPGANPVVDEDVPKAKDQPIYEAFTAEGGWLGIMEGLHDTSGSGDDFAGEYGVGIRYIGINGVGKYRVCDLDTGWWGWVDHFDKRDEENGMAGNGSTICAIEIPNNKIKYQVHTINGEWLDWMIGNKDTGGSSDTYAGEMGVGIDAIRIKKA